VSSPVLPVEFVAGGEGRPELSDAAPGLGGGCGKSGNLLLGVGPEPRKIADKGRDLFEAKEGRVVIGVDRLAVLKSLRRDIVGERRDLRSGGDASSPLTDSEQNDGDGDDGLKQNSSERTASPHFPVQVRTPENCLMRLRA
jgi:hypothetical protein